jgi:hypothetical protein
MYIIASILLGEYGASNVLKIGAVIHVSVSLADKDWFDNVISGFELDCSVHWAWRI